MAPDSIIAPPEGPPVVRVRDSRDGEIFRDVELLMELTRKELRVRYKSSFLGYLWSILNPLVLALVFYVAFQMIIRLQVENYALFLVSGLFTWQWFANSVQGSANLYFGNRDFVKKVPIRREFIPLAAVLHDALHFLASLPVVVAMIIMHGSFPTWSWLWGIPLFTLAQIAFLFGITLIVAGGNVLVRDLERIAAMLVLVLFYLTPVIYPDSMIPEQYRLWFALNPMYHFVVGFRALFAEGTVVWIHVLGAYVAGTASLAAGLLIHRRIEWKIPEAI